MFLANLLRVGNSHISDTYALEALTDVYRQIVNIYRESEIPEDSPIVGRHAYSSILSEFEQKPGRPMDLPPEAVGSRYRYHIAPAVSDNAVIRARLLESFGGTAESYPDILIDTTSQTLKDALENIKHFLISSKSTKISSLTKQ